MKKTKLFIGYFLVPFVVFFFGWESAHYYFSQKVPTIQAEMASATQTNTLNPLLPKTQNVQADLDLYWKVWKKLNDGYVDETALDRQKMVYGSIKGMVDSLEDPYTVFMTPDEAKEFDASLNGTLEGIGAELTVKDKMLTIVSAIKGSPAEKTGLLPDDIIYKIDGTVASELTLPQAITKIRGKKGTKVTLTLIRKGMEKPFDVSIIRDQVNIASVEASLKDKSIAYISIHEFSDKTKKEFDKAMRESDLKNAKGIIIDLRYNGGGYLHTSVELLSEFIKGKKEAVIIKKRQGTSNEVIYVSGHASFADVPLVVLVNKGSASASEIFAGAIQDHKRGIILGEQTFGKGSVQEVDALPDGSSLRYTIAKWYTPSGKSISDVGITPDRVITLTEEDLKAKKDLQLEEAIKYLKNL